MLRSLSPSPDLLVREWLVRVANLEVGPVTRFSAEFRLSVRSGRERDALDASRAVGILGDVRVDGRYLTHEGRKSEANN